MFSDTLLYSSIQRHNNNSLYSYVAANHQPNTAQCFHRFPPWVEKLWIFELLQSIGKQNKNIWRNI